MTLPVAWERRAPVAAAAAVAVGAVVNELLIGPLVRCGAALPAVFAIAFFVGTRLHRPAAGHRPGVLPRRRSRRSRSSTRSSALPSWSPGCPWWRDSAPPGSWSGPAARAAAALRDRNAELREQREQTAQLAVAADRARVAGGLDSFLRDRITAMAAAAAAGREQVFSDPAAADGAFAAVETSGRATLSQMREVVGALRDESAHRAAAGAGAARQPAGAGHQRRRPAPGRGQPARAARRRGAVRLPDRRAPAGRPAGRARRPASTCSCGSPPMRWSCEVAGPVAGRLIRRRRSPWSASGPRCWAGRCGSRPGRPVRRARPAAAGAAPCVTTATRGWHAPG